MGKYLRKAQIRLAARQKAWESAGSNYQHGHKKPGSLKK